MYITHVYVYYTYVYICMCVYYTYTHTHIHIYPGQTGIRFSFTCILLLMRQSFLIHSINRPRSLSIYTFMRVCACARACARVCVCRSLLTL